MELGSSCFPKDKECPAVAWRRCIKGEEGIKFKLLPPFLCLLPKLMPQLQMVLRRRLGLRLAIFALADHWVLFSLSLCRPRRSPYAKCSDNYLQRTDCKEPLRRKTQATKYDCGGQTRTEVGRPTPPLKSNDGSSSKPNQAEIVFGAMIEVAWSPPKELGCVVALCKDRA